jgi:cellulose synthase/poly-beta-1,6-N-acetylglucosamine synthase-like glycosyltransferase
MLSFLVVVFYLFFTYFVLVVLYLFCLSASGLLFRRTKLRGGIMPESNLTHHDAKLTKRIAILVPAYKEDGIILSSMMHHLELDYPKELYDVYLLADSFQNSTLDELKSLPVEVLVMSFEKSTKIKSLNDALRRIQKNYDIAVISDADNVLARDFLKKIHAGFLAGDRVIQGRRVAKNTDTSFAVLDACSEAINNHIFRKGANALGLSSPLIGSGTAFDFSMLRELLKGIDSSVEDKVLQLKIVQQGIFIRYMEDALVFDEKVGSHQAFGHQRKRWVSGQFVNLRESFLPACRELFRGNMSFFNLGVVNNLILPRAFLFVLLPAMVVAGFFLAPFWGIAAAIVLAVYLFSLTIAIPRALFNKELFSALLTLPKAIVVMAGALFQMKKSHKVFIHTVHTKTEISNSLFNDNGK